MEGKIGEMGVSNFDPHKFNGLNKAVNGQLVTNQIEWNPVCFEHFNMMDDLTASGIHPMIWSPLAGGRMFDANDSLCAAAMKTIKRIAEKHDADPSAIIYAWIMYHPAGAVPISGSNRLDRLDTAIKALDIRLEYQPSGYMDVEEMAKVLKKHLPKYVSCDKIISVVSRRVGMADDADSKSVAGNRVRVQVPLPASIRVRVMAHETRKDPCRS